MVIESEVTSASSARNAPSASATWIGSADEHGVAMGRVVGSGAMTDPALIEDGMVEAIEHGCPKLRRFIAPAAYQGVASDIASLVTGNHKSKLPRLNMLMEVAKDDQVVEWGEMAAEQAFAPVTRA